MMAGSAIWANVIPEIGVLDLGYMFQDFNHFDRTLDGTVGKSLEAMLAEKSGVMVLGWSHSFGARNILTKKLVKVPEDLAGMRIRSLPSPAVVETVRAMGALPTPMPIGEAYVSLQTGLVDGIEHDAPTVLAAKFFETAKFYCLTQHTFQAIPPLLSKQSFERIPANLREGFLSAAKEAVLHERRMALTAEADDGRIAAERRPGHQMRPVLCSKTASVRFGTTIAAKNPRPNPSWTARSIPGMRVTCRWSRTLRGWRVSTPAFGLAQLSSPMLKIADAFAGFLLGINICVVCFSVICRYVFHEQYRLGGRGGAGLDDGLAFFGGARPGARQHGRHRVLSRIAYRHAYWPSPTPFVGIVAIIVSWRSSITAWNWSSIPATRPPPPACHRTSSMFRW